MKPKHSNSKKPNLHKIRMVAEIVRGRIVDLASDWAVELAARGESWRRSWPAIWEGLCDGEALNGAGIEDGLDLDPDDPSYNRIMRMAWSYQAIRQAARRAYLQARRKRG